MMFNFVSRRLLSVLLLGFCSGLPLLLTSSTLTIRLTDSGVDRTTIGLFIAVSLPYSFKPLWSFVVDLVRIPIFSKILGHRLGWLLFTQITLFISIFMLGLFNPAGDGLLVALLAFIVAFCSATQDIVIDAIRIGLLNKDEQALGAAMYVYGYRIAMITSGAGALVMSAYISWQLTHLIISIILVIAGSFAIWFIYGFKVHFDRYDCAINSLHNIIIPFKDFMQKSHWFALILFIILFKLPDGFLTTMANVLYIELGFTKQQIGLVVKSFGFVMTMFGSFIGGIITKKIGLNKTIFYSMWLIALSNLFYLLLVYYKNNIEMLYLVIAVENVCSAISNVVIIAFLSNLCNIKFSATQYAFLSSISSLGRTFFSIPTGWVVDQFGWTSFLVFTVLSIIPALILFRHINKPVD